jgi:hypothetical protein
MPASEIQSGRFDEIIIKTFAGILMADVLIVLQLTECTVDKLNLSSLSEALPCNYFGTLYSINDFYSCFFFFAVKSREPKFTNRFTFVEVNAEHFNYGVPLRYNHTTYPGDDECPCSVFEYSIIDVEDVMTPDNLDRFNIFEIDRLVILTVTQCWFNVMYFSNVYEYLE